MGIDGDLMIGYAFSMQRLLKSYKAMNPGDTRSLEELEEIYGQNDEDPQVEKWVEACMETHYTQRNGKRMKYSFQANPTAKVLQCQRWSDTQPTVSDLNFGVGFYVTNFRCSEGENSRVCGLQEFVLSDAEKVALNAAVLALGLEADGSLQVIIRS
eukprot:TRINITY_DN1997_c0_g1_i1.p1 TRINITY_DN1997_c0_g1~~TRINITY_DN1997_c0_g1_i1.p1  ORF type:complete len:156 (-),score=30.71 TRINITY_DN1997_c0_g1_i1:188-655(-)